jgi:hypothetical protein
MSNATRKEYQVHDKAVIDVMKQNGCPLKYQGKRTFQAPFTIEHNETIELADGTTLVLHGTLLHFPGVRGLQEDNLRAEMVPVLYPDLI